jgi:cytidyltransferase-like protein
LHVGHVRLFTEAKKLGDRLLVIVNGDSWLRRKKVYGEFMHENERAEIISRLAPVDMVVVWDDGRDDVANAIRTFKPAVFAKGGDRASFADLPMDELHACLEVGTKIVFNVGGEKIQSSSQLTDAYLRKYEEKQKVQHGTKRRVGKAIGQKPRKNRKSDLQVG